MGIKRTFFMSPKNRREKNIEKEIHRLFDFTLVLKALTVFAELAGGVFLYVISAENIKRVANFFLRGELMEDPHDIIANYLLTMAQSFGGTSKLFAALYLIGHGIVNGLIVVGLWKEKTWAYPVSFIVLGAFTAYQIYLLTFGYSLWLVLLTILDVVILLLAWHEYRTLKKSI